MSTTTAAILSILSAIVVVLVGSLMMFTGIIVHELGHLCGCLLAGWKPLSVHFGSGRSRTLFHRGDTSFQIGLNPFNGLVRVVAVKRDFYRLKYFLIVLAGPVATAALALTALALSIMDLPPLFHYLAGLCMITQFMLLAGLIIPHITRIDGQRRPNDSLLLWKILRMKKTQVETNFIQHRKALAVFYLKQDRIADATAVIEPAPQLPAGPLNVKLQLLYLQLMAVEKFQEARESMRHLSREMEGDAKIRAETLDALACIPLFSGYMELLDDAMDCIGRALIEAPEMITLKGTKASLLVEKGRLDEGMSMLEEVLAKTESDNDRAICKYYMALAYRRKGEVNRAHEWLRDAQKFAPQCLVRQRISQELALSPPVLRNPEPVIPAS